MPGPLGWRRHQQLLVLGPVAVLVALGCLGLGRWQWERYHDKHERRQLVAANYDAPAAPLEQVLPRDANRLAPDLQWLPVRVSGRYDIAATTLVRNRVRDVGSGPRYGYEVLVPLRMGDGSALVVDRGWVPNGTTGERPGEQPDTVPAPPPGQVEVTARLRPSEPGRVGQVPSGQLGSISLDRLGARLGYPLRPAYGALVSESPAASSAPAPLLRPDPDGREGINASYAVQWVVLAGLALGFPFWYLRRQRSLTSKPDVVPDEPPRVRRRRVWDEEDE